MKVYLKIHTKEDWETVACCDENLLNTVLKEGNLRIEISLRFFGGSLVDVEEAMNVLKETNNFNIVGETVVNKAIDCNILSKEGVRSINGVPMAIKMIFK